MNKKTGIKQALGITIAAAAALSMSAGTASAASSCTFVAAPSGSDSNSGSVTAPFLTAQKLVSSLGAGQDGCLRAGIYAQDVRFVRAGTLAAPITLRNYPGEDATVVGRMWVMKGADHVTVKRLHLDGRNPANFPSPTINANFATFIHDDVTDDHTAICFALGNAGWGVADHTVITNNRIHDCGVMPATNYDHGIYVDDATNTQISWNVIYNNADRGIQLYPNAQNTTIDHNILDGNGENIMFSGDGGQASSATSVYDNIMSNARIRNDVESWYPAGNPLGINNTVHNNCVWGGKQGTINTSSGGFSAYANTTANPGYVNASTQNFTLPTTSPCLATTGNVAALAVGGTGNTRPAIASATRFTHAHGAKARAASATRSPRARHHRAHRRTRQQTVR